MSALAALRRSMLPPAGVPRRFALSNLLVGIGNGTFLTGSAVFFTQVTDLRPLEIGAGLSIASGAALLSAVPLSRLVDRFGAQRSWLLSTLVKAVLFAAWPLPGDFVSFVLLMILIELTTNVQETGLGVYLMEAMEPEIRVLAQAYGRSWLNVGWSVGALFATAALAIGTTTAYYALPVVNAALLVLSALLIWRLPGIPAAAHRATSAQASVGVFRNRPFLAVTAACAVLYAYTTVLGQVMPLWLITETDAAQYWLGLLMITNTLIAVTLQVPMTRGLHTLRGATRALQRSGWGTAAACPILFATGITSGWATVVLLLFAVVLLTLAEIWQSIGAWTVVAELSPHNRRGEYLGAFKMGGAIQEMIAPVALVALALTTGGWGWFVIAAVFVAAGLSVRPVIGAATTAGRRTADENPGTATG